MEAVQSLMCWKAHQCRHTYPVFKSSNIFQTCVLVRRNKGGGTGTHFRNEPGNHHMLVNMILASNQLWLCFAVYLWIQNKMSAKIQTSTLELNPEDVTASPKTTILCSGRTFAHTMNSRCVLWVTICSAAIRRFVPQTTTRFLSQRQNRWNNHLNQRCKNSLWEHLKMQDPSKLQSKTGMRWSWKKHWPSFQRIYQTKIYRRIHLKRPKLVPFWTFSSQSIESPLRIYLEVSPPLHGAVWIRTSRGVTQWARHLSEISKEIEGTDTMFINGGTAVAVCHARHWGPTAFLPPSVHGKDTPKPREIFIGNRRWYMVGHRERNSHEPNVISK